MTAVRLRAAFVAASIAWAVLLVAVPFAASQPHVSAMAAALIAGVYAIGGLVCHQLQERSYQLWTAQMPVCARCTGIYFGAALGAIASAVSTAKAVRHTGAETVRTGDALRQTQRVVQSRPANAVAGRFNSARTPRVALAAAVAPTVISLAYEWTTGIRPSHEIRAAAGVPIGLVVAWLVVAATDNQVN
jgi:hypothetical protein